MMTSFIVLALAIALWMCWDFWDSEPWQCPYCGYLVSGRKTCPRCGWKI